MNLDNDNVRHWDYKSPVNLWSFPRPELSPRVVREGVRARTGLSPRVVSDKVDVGKFYELRKVRG